MPLVYTKIYYKGYNTGTKFLFLNLELTAEDIFSFR